MAVFILFLSALVLVSAAAAAPLIELPVLSESDYEAKWEAWQEKYGYENVSLSLEQDSQIRYLNFRTNVDRVRSHNARAAADEFSFTLDLNHLADLSDAEYRGMLGLRNVGGDSFAQVKRFLREEKEETTSLEDFEAPTNGTVPASWDWRTVSNVVNPVKNQGGCGSCWAFSAVATMEGAWNKKHGQLSSFSEQQLVDCVNAGKDTCTVGGEMYQGVAQGAKTGMELESSYKYRGSSGGGCEFDKSKVVGEFSGYRNVTAGSETALKAAAFHQPIVSVGIDASSFWFQLYHSGVFDLHGLWGKCKNDAADLDHGVAIVGYDHDTKSGKDYWIVRNSWGGMWGQKGYIWMVRNKDNQCGVATQACFAEL